jgi:hypothetical protein
MTLLHKIALSGFLTLEVLQFLRNSGIHHDALDSSGKTALQYATTESERKRHPHLFDVNRWSRTANILQDQEALAIPDEQSRQE